MSLVRAVAAHLHALGVGVWGGTDPAATPRIWINEQAQSPVASLTVWVEPDGAMPDVDLDGGDRAERTCDIRVLVRHPGDSTGRTVTGQAIAQSIIGRLHGASHMTLTDTPTGTVYHVTQILARSSVPTPLGPDESGNHEWTVVFSCIYDQEI